MCQWSSNKCFFNENIVCYNLIGYNIYRKGFWYINIIKSKAYKKTEKKVFKNKTKELEKLDNIKNAIIISSNLHELMLSKFKYIYDIRKKHGDLKEIYSASLNGNIRLLFKPVGKYPYNEVEIFELEFLEINDTHYKGVKI